MFCGVNAFGLGFGGFGFVVVGFRGVGFEFVGDLVGVCMGFSGVVLWWA